MRFAPSSLAGRRFAIGSNLFAIVGLSIAVGLGQPRAADIDLDFDTEPPQFFGHAERRSEGGNPGGYISVTDALNGQRGAIIFPPVDTGGAFSIGADLRVGGGTDMPADGFSFNFARPGDPVLDDGEDWASSPTGEGNLPEEGTTTGLAIGFDEWFSGGDDVIGMSIRIDNVLVRQIEFPTLNGELADLTSLQTGPLVDDGADPLDHLGWARLEISLDADSNLTIAYKGLEVFNEVVAYEAGVGQLVFGGRTGGSNGNHHIDNISIKTGAGEFDLNFDTALPQFFGDAQRRNDGGNPGGYVSVTDALNGQRGAIIFAPVDTGGAFSIGADLRVGGGTDMPADGFSFNFARPGDPVLDDGEDWASSPTGEGNLPEEGTTTGLAIGFDEWFSGGDDVIGMSIRIDNVLVRQIEFPTLNGELADLTSLQTGPLVDDGADPLDHLGWARLEISLDADSNLTIAYKGLEVFNEVVAYEAGVGQLVFGGRTGGSNGNHHIDNISIRTAGVVAAPPGGPQLAGDCDQNGVRDISDLICNIKILFPGFLLLPREGAADPCVSGDGSVSVLDVNGDGSFTSSDALYLANFLFIGGPPPTQGEECFLTAGECAVSLGCE